MYKDPAINMVVRPRRLQWLSCLERMEEENTMKRLTVRRPNLGRRQVDYDSDCGTLS